MYSTIIILPFLASIINGFFSLTVLACFLIGGGLLTILIAESLSNQIQDRDLRAIYKPTTNDRRRPLSDFVWTRVAPGIRVPGYPNLVTRHDRVFIFDSLDRNGTAIELSFFPTRRDNNVIFTTFRINGIEYRGAMVPGRSVVGETLKRVPSPFFDTRVTPFYTVTSRNQPIERRVRTLYIKKSL